MDVTNIVDDFYKEQIRQEDEREREMWDKLDRYAEKLFGDGAKD